MKLKDIIYKLMVVERLNKKCFKKFANQTVMYEGYHFIQIGKTILWMDEVDCDDVIARLDFWEVPYIDVAIFDKESTRGWGKVRSWDADADLYYQELKNSR